jgi:hypothetical protein
MNGTSHILIRKLVAIFTMTGLLSLFVFGMGASPVVHAQGGDDPTVTPEPASEFFTSSTIMLRDGRQVEAIIIHGPPYPPVGIERASMAMSPFDASAQGVVMLDVPAFDWSFGCSATSGSMIAAYYDRNGYPNMYTGPTNAGVMPSDSSSWPDWTDGAGDTYGQCPLTASHNGLDGRTTNGSIDDYWVSYMGGAQDPYITGGWTQHAWGDAIGDYMKTSQSSYGNDDGSTVFYNWTSSTSQLTCSDMVSNNITVDGTYGRKQFYEAKGYTVTSCYNQKTDNNGGGFTFAMFMAQIDAGRPVMLNLAGHTIVGLGYDSATSTVYIHDTWDYGIHSFTWGGSYAGMALQSVSIVNLAPISTNTYTLTVGKTGTGSGTVTSDPAGINCGSTCSYGFNTNASVTLTAAPSSGSTFTGWSGSGCSGTGTCSITMDAAKSITANFDINSYTLTVGKTGTGSGTVTSVPSGINCGSTCSYAFSYNTSVTLTAAPTGSSTFGGWSGACSGTGTCTVVMIAARSVTATFNSSNNQTLTVTKSGTGSGTVTSSPAGINCGSTCSYAFAYNTSVTLTAAATSPSTFAGWSGGGCSGTRSTCRVSMSTARSVTATFNLPGNQTLTVRKSGTGTGTVTSAPTGINCGSTCSYAFAYNTSVSLTAAPTGASTFAGWSGGGCSGTATCTVVMSAARSVTATFNSTGTQTLTVTKSGTGSGTVTSSPSGINCGSTCSYAFSSNTSVTLRASAAAGSRFTGWSGGGCSGTKTTCTVRLNTAASVNATFTKR